MLVVRGLVWPMLFGENPLHATQALVDHYVPPVTFRHPSMQFRVQCSLDNPPEGFASISVPKNSSSCESGSTAPNTFQTAPNTFQTAPNTFQRILNTVFADYLNKWLVVYVDGLIQWAMTGEEALEHYSLLFQRLGKVGMQLKPSKCTFFAIKIETLGHQITQEGRTPISKE